MRPFFSFFGLAVPAFFIMIVLAALVSFGLILAGTRKSGRLDAVYYFVVILCGAFVGAWLLHTLINLPRIINAWQIIRVTMPLSDALEYAFLQFSGMIFYGGLLGGVVAMFAYSKHFNVPLLPFMDLFAPILLVAHAIGRLGCFFAGCCYGVVVDSGFVFAIIYPPESLAAPSGLPLLAVPLVEAVLNLVLACGIFLFKRFRRSTQPGYLTVIYLLAYPAMRFILEFFRGDGVRGIFMGVSTSQWISMMLFSTGIVLLLRLQYISNKQGS